MGNPRIKKNESVEAFNERASKYYYSNGYNIKEIANKLKISEVIVYNYVAHGRKITTNEEREKMIKLFNAGYSYTAIGKIFNRSRTCVRKRIQSPARVRCSQCENTINDSKLRKMKVMAKDGVSLETIAKELDANLSSIKYRLHHSGLRTPNKFISEDEVKEFIKLYKQGKSYNQIARLCNRSKSAVSRHLHNAGYYRSKESK